MSSNKLHYTGKYHVFHIHFTVYLKARLIKYEPREGVQTSVWHNRSVHAWTPISYTGIPVWVLATLVFPQLPHNASWKAVDDVWNDWIPVTCTGISSCWLCPDCWRYLQTEQERSFLCFSPAVLSVYENIPNLKRNSILYITNILMFIIKVV